MNVLDQNQNVQEQRDNKQERRNRNQIASRYSSDCEISNKTKKNDESESKYKIWQQN